VESVNARTVIILVVRNQLIGMITDATRYPIFSIRMARKVQNSSSKLEPYLIDQPCEVCQGKRSKPKPFCAALGLILILLAHLFGVPAKDKQFS